MSLSLRAINQKTNVTTQIGETNLERGRIWSFTLNHYAASAHFPSGFCWIAPAAGCVVLDVWGAAGSSGSACCCGYGLPGNPGAYVRRCFNTSSGCFICGCFGNACRNLGVFRGCSDPSCVCWTGGGSGGIICAQGGAGGRAFCINGNSMLCCFQAVGACVTTVGTGCGFVCNHCAGAWIASGCGGQINCSGGISCVFFGNCNPCCMCLHQHYVKTSPGTLSNDTNTIVFGIDFNAMGMSNSGITHQAMANALVSITRSSTTLPYATCWNSQSACACWEGYACQPWFGIGVPGGPTIGFPNVRDFGMMGSHGAVRIQFIAS